MYVYVLHILYVSKASIDFILQALNEKEMSQKYGFPLVQHLNNIIGESFADDAALFN
jgi:hypothetical protein